MKKTYIKPTLTDLTLPSAHADTPDGRCLSGFNVGNPDLGFCGTGLGPDNPTNCATGGTANPQAQCSAGTSPLT